MRWSGDRPSGPPERTLPQVTQASNPLDRDDLRERVNAALAEVLGRQIDGLAFLDGDHRPVAEALRTFVLDAGKRIRPAFVYWGWRGAGGPAGAPADPVLRAACAVELLHACALIHDDIMDGSRTRRGRPAVHVGFAGLHERSGWRGDPDAFGAGAAILMGDLAFAWADAALTGAGLADDQLRAAFEVFNVLRSEMIGGQYLDLVEAQRGPADEAAVRRVLRYKSARYTIERPLQMGAAMAPCDPGRRADAVAVYEAYGLPLGEAFQLRDDVLGVFGDASVTGKPAGDDLREGKETWLVLRTRQLAGPSGLRLLESSLGDAKLSGDALAAVRDVIVSCGALADTEARIGALVAEATAAVDRPAVEPEAARALVELAVHVTDRRA
jgi:geranylgeranyl diphosphate synthase, type I